jgi:GT2 family glycosyltransferase
MGVVVIGRNEGERLQRCLESLRKQESVVVYVDSGSTDGSLDLCQAMAVPAVQLDMTVPFTAARARNEGVKFILSLQSDTAYIQFIDGDCEMRAGWLERAATEFAARSDAAVVCGRVRERRAEATIYNRLCDIEWNGPVGEIDACGGIAMMRVTAFTQVGGFNSAVIAAEDDEICLRMRQAGWKIVRIHEEMTLHDAAMTRFSQWWKRAVRCGYAYALWVALHGRTPERHFVREQRRAILWAVIIPATSLVLSFPTHGWSLLLFSLYPLQLLRTYQTVRRRVPIRRHALEYAVSCVVAKFPQVLGIFRYNLDRLKQRQAQIIEYK